MTLNNSQNLFDKKVKMIFAIELKKHIISICIFNIIIDKFCCKKKLCSVILFSINKSLKVDLYHLILFFDLAIYIKIKSGEKFLLDNKKIV